MRWFAIALLIPLALVLLAAPATADLGRRDPAWSGPAPGFSPPVPLSRSDRMMLQPGTGAVITVYVSMQSNWLNATERGMVMETLKSKYGFASTLINFTTVKPTTGSYHQLNITPDRDTVTGDGLVWGEAWSTTANIYGGEFTADPNVSTWFSNSTARSNAIGENAAHELDHILRGAGHSRNPGDVNCDGTLVPASQRAQDNRSFTEADKQQKIRNITNGHSYKPYRAKDEKQNFNVMPVFGGTGWPEEFKPDCTWVTITVELMAAPEVLRLGFMTDEGAWDFSDGLDPAPGVYSTCVPAGVLLDFAVIDVFTGDAWAISDYGNVIPLGVPIDPLLSINPVVNEPYFSGANLTWNIPSRGIVMATLQTRAPEGFKIFPTGQGGLDDGDLSPTPRLLQNSPNPFTRSTEISFQVPAAKDGAATVPVRLSLFDVQGRLVRVIVNAPMEPGLQRVTLDATSPDSMPSGIYFYRLEVAGEKLTRKLLLMR